MPSKGGGEQSHFSLQSGNLMSCGCDSGEILPCMVQQPTPPHFLY